MSSTVVVHMSQSIVYVGLVCLCVAQKVTTKGACAARALSVCLFLQTWLENNWQSSSLVTTMACARPVFLVTVHLALCLQMPGMMVGMDQMDGKIWHSGLRLKSVPFCPRAHHADNV